MVIGAGISGLTTGVALAEAGIEVTIISHDHPADTNSAKAGASWGPYMVSHEHMDVWSAQTYDLLTGIAGDEDSGVRLLSGIEAFTKDSFDAWSERTAVPPSWAEKIAGFERLDFVDGEPNPKLPPGYHFGWQGTIPIVNMPRYLEYLVRRFLAAGGNLRVGDGVRSFSDPRLMEMLGPDTAVVNCTGLGASGLVPDTTMEPTRGQLVMVENPGITEFFQDNPAPGERESTHIFPHGDVVVVGGCDYKFKPGEPWEAQEADPEVTERILRRAERIEPRLVGARRVDAWVGLRPVRTAQVRVERDPRRDIRLIHNYGHGGAGITLSWGCVIQVGQLLGVAVAPPDTLGEDVDIPTLNGVLTG